MKSKRRFPFDYLAVIAVIVAANLIIGALAEKNIRQRAFENALGKLARHDAKEEISLLVLGDSRSARINEVLLATETGVSQNQSLNLSSNSGSWVSCFSLLRETESNLSKQATVLLCLSEYWLERPNLHDQAGFLPAWDAYLALGLHQEALTSKIPLSSKRGQIVNRIRSFAENPFRATSKNNGSIEERFEGMEKSNVDLWFSPIKKEQIAENLAFADHALKKIKAMSPRLVLAYLPNATIRESYVAGTYKGRKARFIQNISLLAQKHGLPFIDMSSEQSLSDNDLYSDFHHWNEAGSREGTEALAALLDRDLDK